MKPRALLLYYSFTDQTRRIADAMAEALREENWEVAECAIEFIDPHYRIDFPLKPFWPKLLRWFLPQMLGKTGAIRVPEHVVQEEYDLVCIGSPTWWLNPAMPVVSFLKTSSAQELLDGRRFAVFAVCRAFWGNNLRNVKKLAKRQGGRFVDGAAFCFQGNQIQTALSFANYVQTGTDRDRYWGMKIYEFGIPDEGIEKAKSFARDLATTIKTVESRSP